MEDAKVRVLRDAAAEVRTPLLVVQMFEDEPEIAGSAAEVDIALGGAIGAVLERGDFDGAAEQTTVLYPATDSALGADRVLLVGAGKRDALTAESVRRTVGRAVREAERLRVESLALALDHVERAGDRLDLDGAALAATEAAVLAAWDYRELKSEPAKAEKAPSRVSGIALVATEDEAEATLERAAERGRITAGAENLARALAMRPGNVATPTHLAETAEAFAREHGLDITVLDRRAMERERMGALLAVAQGSEEEPRFIVLEHRGAGDDSPPLVLVGKGVTFDAGGISIKPSKKMEQMKYDMSGAAAVLGAMRAVAELDLPVNVVGLVPSTENLPSGTAVKPGDVIRSHAGKTIEIINTDAEGRLILADALSWAQRYEPAAIMDAATLTGACVIALGHHAVALMGTDDALTDELRAIGERTGERCWPLPLWDDYRKQLDSDVADIKNTGGRPAGSITAGWFLREFAGDAPWAHLDIAGTAWLDEPPPYLRKGASGVPTRLFIEWIRSRAEG